MTKKPDISVVIAAYNEEKCLPACLKSLKKQDFTGDFEVIVVDNNSADQTAVIAKKWGARVVPEKIQGIAPAKDRGAKAAQGEIIAFLDADTECPPNWLTRIKKNFTEKKIVAATGPYIYKTIRRPFFRKINLHFHNLLLIISRMLNGGNMIVKKVIFEKVGGFSKNIRFGEDLDLALKVRRLGRIAYDHHLAVLESGRRLQAGIKEYSVYVGYTLKVIFSGRKEALKEVELKPIR